MKIERKTKVQQIDENALKTTIPATIRDVMGIKKGTILKWTLENENEVRIRKQDIDKSNN